MTNKRTSDSQENASKRVCPEKDVQAFKTTGPTGESLYASLPVPKWKIMCDVNVVVEEVEFPCHRIMLAHSSPFFEVMFTNGMKESHSKELSLKGISKDVWGSVLQAHVHSRLWLHY